MSQLRGPQLPAGGIPGEAFAYPPPSYIDNLQSRLIKARKGIFPASLKMILKTKYPLPVRRPAPETSVQPDDVIGEHRAGENNPLSQCAAIDTGSEKPGTPPRSSVIGTGSGPGVSETQIMEEEEISLLKPVWMVFCVQTAEAPSRSVFCCNQTSG